MPGRWLTLTLLLSALLLLGSADGGKVKLSMRPRRASARGLSALQLTPSVTCRFKANWKEEEAQLDVNAPPERPWERERHRQLLADVQSISGPAAGQYDIWILAGGSDMVGENGLWTGEWPDEGLPVAGGRLMMFPRAAGVWMDAMPNVGLRTYGMNVDNDLGPEMCFGRHMLDQDVSLKVGFIPVALGGSVLHNDWLPGREKKGVGRFCASLTN